MLADCENAHYEVQFEINERSSLREALSDCERAKKTIEIFSFAPCIDAIR